MGKLSFVIAGVVVALGVAAVYLPMADSDSYPECMAQDGKGADATRLKAVSIACERRFPYERELTRGEDVGGAVDSRWERDAKDEPFLKITRNTSEFRLLRANAKASWLACDKGAFSFMDTKKPVEFTVFFNREGTEAHFEGPALKMSGCRIMTRLWVIRDNYRPDPSP
ncbi:hypothetical protein DFR24_0551 [Panacagrimonas perspica]|uniref:Uncharacterized protein n=1 Tax=Panacagrimonas perspica TaxID=381431 RepID=A0A4S3K3F0_9GAMM|nr:hypothetical protein [Panacagrimonas perspica]TDU31192.1 hypothetical protein DFR24_0551 [Panacagrimonas perspica]THD02549.1 hypothetical protein B1810_13395 [Panacagrimonas perspica]